MQTFLPSPSFAQTARLLDTRRLGKQRVEVMQILRAVVWPRYGWKNHPATAMWRGFTRALVCYGLAMCAEWQARGHHDTVGAGLLAYTGGEPPRWPVLRAEGLLPPWLGDPALHASHRAALLRKDPAHYGPLFGESGDFGEYVWPAPVFSRWPVRRPHPLRPLAPSQAVALLGVDNAVLDPQLCAALGALTAGRAATVASLTLSQVVVAGLCTPGMTACYVPGPPLPESLADEPVWQRESDGSPTRSIAREPGPEDLAAIAAETDDVSEFRFLRAGQPLPPPIDRFGLVVADRAQPSAPPRIPVLSAG